MSSRRLTPEQKQRKKEYNRRWYEANQARILAEKKLEYASSEEIREQKRVRARAWYAANQDHIQAYRERHKERDRQKSRLNHVRKLYGLTAEEYETLRAAQENRCAICKKEPHNRRRLHVDHCHTTGKVRALLCHYCNVGIGALREDPEIFRQAIMYLESHSMWAMPPST